jgi:hypothetical protein
VSRSLIHIRVKDDDLTRLDAVQKRLGFRSRTQTMEIGMPFLLHHLEEMADTLEETLERKKNAL